MSLLERCPPPFVSPLLGPFALAILAALVVLGVWR